MTPLLAPLLVATAGAISCQPSFKINPSNSGDAFVYYNLMSMNLRGASWTFGDSDHDSQSVRNYTYRIQICGEVESPSKIPACKDNLATATAWQFDSKGDRGECFRLGSHFDDGNAEWSMIDENEPGKGIQLTYFNGDFCPYHQKNRSLTVEIVCENRKTVPPAFVEVGRYPSEIFKFSQIMSQRIIVNIVKNTPRNHTFSHDVCMGYRNEESATTSLRYRTKLAVQAHVRSAPARFAVTTGFVDSIPTRIRQSASAMTDGQARPARRREMGNQ